MDRARDSAGPGVDPIDKGTHDHVDLIYRSQRGPLQRRIRAQVGSSEDANDILQEAFSRLLGARAGESIRNPGAFLNRIVRNLLIDRSRRQSATPPHIPLASEELLSVPPDQSHTLELDQMRRRYREIVDALPPRTRQVFLLHRVEELGYREIAERLDVSIRTVEWHVAQAIYRIGKELNDE